MTLGTVPGAFFVELEHSFAYNTVEVIKVQGTTSEELIMIKTCCMLPIMLDMVEKQKQDMEKSSAMMKTLYLAALEKLQNTIHADLVETRKQLRTANIKMWKVDNTEVRKESAFKYKINCRGYDGVFEMLRNFTKAEISKKFGIYIAKTMS